MRMVVSVAELEALREVNVSEHFGMVDHDNFTGLATYRTVRNRRSWGRRRDGSGTFRPVLVIVRRVTSEPVSSPVTAANDGAAIFELLMQVSRH